MTKLGVVEILFSSQISALIALCHQGGELLVDDFVHSLSVCLFDRVSMVLLVAHEDFKFVGLRNMGYIEGLLGLHVSEKFVAVQVRAHKVRSGPNEVLGKDGSGAVEGLLADVALPEAEDLADQVVFEKLHGRQHVKHGALHHPLRQGNNVGGSVACVGVPVLLGLVDHVGHALGRNNVVLIIEGSLVVVSIQNGYKVVRSEL